MLKISRLYVMCCRFWVCFMAWHTEYMVDRNDVDDLNSIYNDECIITLDELPD